MNDYFNAPTTPVDFTTARASLIQQLFASVAAAFDKLPSLAALLQGRVNFAVATGDGDTIAATFDVAPESYVEGASFRLKLNATNSGAATLNVCALGAKSIVTASGGALAGGELVAGNVQTLTYVDGVFRLPATGPAGPQGPTGPANGTQLLGGTADPGAGTGNNGDYYINRTSWTIFGPKAAGAWPAGVSIVGANGTNGAAGAAGADGFSVLNGSGAPGGGVGINSDFYIDTTAHAIYGPKAAGAWGTATSLVGPAGADGSDAVVDEAADYAFTGLITVKSHEAGFRDLPISRTVSANFTLADTDRGCAIVYNDSNDSCTVPLNSSVAIPVGAIITVVNDGATTLTLLRQGGVTMKLAGTGSNANRVLAIGGYAWFHKISTNTWYVGGDVT